MLLGCGTEEIRGKGKLMSGTEPLWELLQASRDHFGRVGYLNGDLGEESDVPGEKDSGW